MFCETQKGTFRTQAWNVLLHTGKTKTHRRHHNNLLHLALDDQLLFVDVQLLFQADLLDVQGQSLEKVENIIYSYNNHLMYTHPPFVIFILLPVHRQSTSTQQKKFQIIYSNEIKKYPFCLKRAFLKIPLHWSIIDTPSYS
jgi:hypothetical protein